MNGDKICYDVEIRKEGGGLKLPELKPYGMQDEQTQGAIGEAKGTR
jgi:hypothetical protein